MSKPGLTCEARVGLGRAACPGCIFHPPDVQRARAGGAGHTLAALTGAAGHHAATLHTEPYDHIHPEVLLLSTLSGVVEGRCMLMVH